MRRKSELTTLAGSLIGRILIQFPDLPPPDKPVMLKKDLEFIINWSYLLMTYLISVKRSSRSDKFILIPAPALRPNALSLSLKVSESSYSSFSR